METADDVDDAVVGEVGEDESFIPALQLVDARSVVSLQLLALSRTTYRTSNVFALAAIVVVMVVSDAKSSFTPN